MNDVKIFQDDASYVSVFWLSERKFWHKNIVGILMVWVKILNIVRMQMALCAMLKVSKDCKWYTREIWVMF